MPPQTDARALQTFISHALREAHGECCPYKVDVLKACTVDEVINMGRLTENNNNSSSNIRGHPRCSEAILRVDVDDADAVCVALTLPPNPSRLSGSYTIDVLGISESLMAFAGPRQTPSIS